MHRSGATKILVHCVYRRAIEMDTGRWPDDMRLSDIEPRFSCHVCGHQGATFDQATEGKNGYLMNYASTRTFADSENAEIAKSSSQLAHVTTDLKVPFAP